MTRTRSSWLACRHTSSTCTSTPSAFPPQGVQAIFEVGFLRDGGGYCCRATPVGNISSRTELSKVNNFSSVVSTVPSRSWKKISPPTHCLHPGGEQRGGDLRYSSKPTTRWIDQVAPAPDPCARKETRNKNRDAREKKTHIQKKLTSKNNNKKQKTLKQEGYVFTHAPRLNCSVGRHTHSLPAGVRRGLSSAGENLLNL